MSEKYLMFQEPQKYDSGNTPRIAVNNTGNLVEVHKSEGFETLWYHTGTMDDAKIKWSGSKQYDKGVTPSVAINNAGRIVEVHQSNGPSTNLWYHVGTLKNGAVTWSDSHKYDKGKAPSVAVNDQNKVVEVHQSDGPSSNLWYHVGELGSNSVAWSDSVKYDTGSTPDVAINNSGIVVEVHQSDGPSTNLWYHVGKLQGNRISWGGSQRLENETGSNPTVTLSDNGSVVVSYCRLGELSRITGKLNSQQNGIKWERVIRCGNGGSPAVSGDSAGKHYALACESGLTQTTLSASTGLQEIDNALEKEMWKFCQLTFKIESDGTIDPQKAKNNGCKTIYSFAVGGENKIHRGFIADTTTGLVMAFRGTDGTDDWLNDFNVILDPCDYGEGKVHRGFMNGTRELVNAGILSNANVKKMIEDYQLNGGRRIYITGHSKGAALATLIAGKVKNDYPKLEILVLTYGSPMTGDSTFKDNYTYRHYRYQSDCDMVPNLPPPPFYHHVGIQVKFQGFHPGLPLDDAHNKDYPEFIGY